MFLAANSGLRSLARSLSQPTAEAKMARDPRPPVVLLRSFFRDHERGEHEPRAQKPALAVDPIGNARRALEDAEPVTGIEEDLVHIFDRIGPTVAIGRPGEVLPPVGAGRLYVGDNEWQEKVRELAARAALVVVIVDHTDGLRWELSNLPSVCSFDRILLLLPRVRDEAWFLGWKEVLGSSPLFPVISIRAVAIRFDASGRPRIYDEMLALDHELERAASAEERARLQAMIAHQEATFTSPGGHRQFDYLWAVNRAVKAL